MDLSRVSSCIFFILIAGCCIVTINGPRADAYFFTRNSTNENFYPLNRFFKNTTRMGNYRLHGEFRDQCSAVQECRESAYQCSRQGICECAPGYMPDQFQETCVGGIGSKCLYDSHCILNAYCKGQQQCACKFEYPIASRDSWTCNGSGSHLSILFNNIIIFCVLVNGIWTI